MILGQGFIGGIDSIFGLTIGGDTQEFILEGWVEICPTDSLWVSTRATVNVWVDVDKSINSWTTVDKVDNDLTRCD